MFVDCFVTDLMSASAVIQDYVHDNFNSYKNKVLSFGVDLTLAVPC